MLKNILNVEGVQKLSKEKLTTLKGGIIQPECITANGHAGRWAYHQGSFVCLEVDDSDQDLQ
ncbi:hypothetical protein GCM10009430_46770 [Aquimarina litoralis]|uniref:Bacteriocin-type signal sequence-containing protein n=1 Tax=Aquimarina litoralis TaxID=584605 RepID=A0ABP3UFW2_9FLAO